MSLLETAALTLMSPALLAGDNNPATNPCLDCGACCSHFRVSFYIGELAGENGGQVPLDLVTQMSPLRACMKGTEMGGGRCTSRCAANWAGRASIAPSTKTARHPAANSTSGSPTARPTPIASA